MNRLQSASLIVLLFACTQLFAQTGAVYQPQSHFLADIAKVFSFLVLILLTIGGSLWLARRAGHFQRSSGGHLQVLDTLPVGTREKIILLQVGQKQLVVGVTSAHMETLHVLQENIAYEAKAPVDLQQIAAQWWPGRKR